jgi:signal transduction histidine kinase
MATKDECISKCSDVANIIKTSGAAEAIRQVNDVNGPYVWKDTYVYIMDLGATIVSHGPQPKFIGRNLMGLKDPVTKMPWYPALFEKINSQNLTNGWFDYHWKKTDAEGIFTKHCYFQREGDLVVFAGIYGDKVK